jgi:group I intron endonuclease
MSSGIYKITLKNDKRCYIGSAVNVSGRWKLHLTNAASKRSDVQVITKAIRKYGADAFD